MCRSRSTPREVSPSMNSQRWFLLVVAAASAAGAALAVMATGRRHRHRKMTQVREHRSDLHSWENEGGNLAPVQVAAVSP